MDKIWSLKELYPSFESEEFIGDLNKFKKLADSYKEWVASVLNSNEDFGRVLKEYIRYLQDLRTTGGKLGSFCSLNLSSDSGNMKASKNEEVIENINSELAESHAQIRSLIGSISNLNEYIDNDDYLKEFKFYLNEIKDNQKYMLSPKEEAIFSKMANTGGNAWAKLKSNLESGLMVDIELDGEKKQMPLTMVRNLARHKDSNIRKIAYEAELKSYNKIDDAVAAALNEVKGQVITEVELRGYDSPLDQALKYGRLKRETLDAMLEAMKEYMPYFRKYLRRKAELLGYENGLPFYELFASVGEVSMEFSYEEAQKFVVENFYSFSKELGELAETAFNNEWIDVYPRKGKRSGAFCSNLHYIKESRVLTNFGGGLKDVITLSHELGHAYHGKCIQRGDILNSRYPMPLAETASTFCETIVKKAAIRKASEEEAFVILETELQGATQIIVDIYSRFLFEKEVFDRRRSGTLSSKELQDIMVWAQKEAYGEGLDQDYLHPFMWICKSHYYRTGLSFYNFPYAFGLLFAKGLYAKYLEMGEPFVEIYNKLLEITGSKNIEEVTKLVDIDVEDISFWRGSLEVLKDDINKFIELSK